MSKTQNGALTPHGRSYSIKVCCWSQSETFHKRQYVFIHRVWDLRFNESKDREREREDRRRYKSTIESINNDRREPGETPRWSNRHCVAFISPVRLFALPSRLHVLLWFLWDGSSWSQALCRLLGLLWSILHCVPEQPLGRLSCETTGQERTEWGPASSSTTWQQDIYGQRLSDHGTSVWDGADYCWTKAMNKDVRCFLSV